MARDSTTETPLASRREVVLPAEAMKTARRERPLLRGLLAVAAGFSPRQTARPSRTPPSGEQVTFIYCVKGHGWCEAAGHLHTVRPGDRLGSIEVRDINETGVVTAGGKTSPLGQ